MPDVNMVTASRPRPEGRPGRRSRLAERLVEAMIVLVGDQDLRDVALSVVAECDAHVDQRLGEAGEGAHVGS